MTRGDATPYESMMKARLDRIFVDMDSAMSRGDEDAMMSVKGKLTELTDDLMYDIRDMAQDLQIAEEYADGVTTNMKDMSNEISVKQEEVKKMDREIKLIKEGMRRLLATLECAIDEVEILMDALYTNKTSLITSKSGSDDEYVLSVFSHDGSMSKSVKIPFMESLEDIEYAVDHLISWLY
jgi:hypothetical protein